MNWFLELVINDWLSVVSASMALIALLVSLKNYKNNQGRLELDLHRFIAQSKKDCIDLSLKLPVNEQTHDRIVTAIKSSTEMLWNAYEEACAKYIDNKVDKERFRKNYEIEIRQLAEKMEKDGKLGTTSPYQGIRKVYKEWNHKEK